MRPAVEVLYPFLHRRQAKWESRFSRAEHLRKNWLPHSWFDRVSRRQNGLGWDIQKITSEESRAAYYLASKRESGLQTSYPDSSVRLTCGWLRLGCGLAVSTALLAGAPVLQENADDPASIGRIHLPNSFTQQLAVSLILPANAVHDHQIFFFFFFFWYTWYITLSERRLSLNCLLPRERTRILFPLPFDHRSHLDLFPLIPIFHPPPLLLLRCYPRSEWEPW